MKPLQLHMIQFVFALIAFCDTFLLKLLSVKMAPTRKLFSTKFKAKVLKYITEKGCSNSVATRNFGIDKKNIRRWKGQSYSLHKVIKNGFFQSQTKYLVLAGNHFQS